MVVGDCVCEWAMVVGDCVCEWVVIVLRWNLAWWKMEWPISL